MFFFFVISYISFKEFFAMLHVCSFSFWRLFRGNEIFRKLNCFFFQNSMRAFFRKKTEQSELNCEILIKMKNLKESSKQKKKKKITHPSQLLIYACKEKHTQSASLSPPLPSLSLFFSRRQTPLKIEIVYHKMGVNYKV